MIEISDYTNLNNNQRNALIRLLTKNEMQYEWVAGIHDNELKLSHRIVKHLSSPKYGPSSNESHIRFEVIDNYLFDSGSYSKIYKSLYTLFIDDENNLIVKKRKEGSKRIIKEQKLKESASVKHLNVMLREANAMRKTSFFHSKPIVWSNSKSFLIMRELTGTNLLNLININEFSIHERYQLTLDLLKALKVQIHDRGYIHRDIKPENIIVNQIENQFVIYIIDYGFIKNHDDDDSLESKGSPPYAAPECYNSGKIKTEKSDIYSMGRVLMYLWGDDNSSEKEYKTCFEESQNPGFTNLFKCMNPKPLQQEEIRDILKKMCDPCMENRPSLDQIIGMFIPLDDKLDPVEQDIVDHELKNDWYNKEEADALENYLGF